MVFGILQIGINEKNGFTSINFALQKLNKKSANSIEKVCFCGNLLLSLHRNTNTDIVNKIRIILSDEAKAFLREQPIKAQQKVAYNIRKVESGVMDKELFEKLSGSNIWELRTLYNGSYYRLFAFWDTEERALVVTTHGMVKKTKKTPPKEITRAEALRKEYFDNKNK